MGRLSASRRILWPLAVWLVVVMALAIGAALIVDGSDGHEQRSAEPKSCAALPLAKRAACVRGLHYSCRVRTDHAAPRPKLRAETRSSTAVPRVGLGVRNCAGNDASAIAVLRPRVVRFEMEAARPSSGDAWVDFYSRLGVTPQPLANFNRVPSDAQIDALAAWARRKASKIKLIEFGNENSYSHRYGDGPGDPSYEARARAYGAAAKRLGQALAGSGVGVLAQADDGDTRSSAWVDGMYAAAPDLHKWVAGWVLHPYGPDYVARLDRLEQQVGPHGGGGLKVYCTELGLATDDGRTLSNNYGWSTTMTYRQAADALWSIVTDLEATGKVAQVMLYQSTDQQASGASSDREGYFGLLQKDGTTRKGALTRTAIRLLAR